MSKTLQSIITSPSLVREQWLSPEVAVRTVLAFERRFGKRHLELACHAALPSMLTPQLINLIHVNFLDDRQIDWIAEVDFLLSQLCCSIDEGLYEIEPCVREVLLVELANLYGQQRAEEVKQEIARFLWVYSHQKPEVGLRLEIRQTHEWIARSYLDPDGLIQELRSLLKASVQEENSLLQMANQTQVLRIVELLPDALEKSQHTTDYRKLIRDTRVVAYTLYGKETIITSKPETALLLSPPFVEWFNQSGKVEEKKIEEKDAEEKVETRKEREQELEQELFYAEQLRIRSIKQGLTAQSLRQQRRRQDELAALLARQAYYFNQQDKLQVLNQVDNALRQILSAPYFSNILKHHSLSFSSIAFSPDGTKLAAGGWDGNIYLWNQEQSYSECKPLAGHEEGINAIAFSPDGQWLASGSRDNTVRLWDLRQKSPVSKVIGKHEKDVTSIAFKPDGSLLASGSKDRTVKLWNWPQLDRSPIVLAEHSSKGQMGMVRSLTFTTYGSQLAVGCDDRSIWLWDVQEPAQAPDKEPAVFYGHGEKIRSVAFSPGGRWLASASDDHTIRLWDITQPQEWPKILQGHTAKVRSVAFSFDGKMLASGSDDQTIRLWKSDKFGKTDKLDEEPQILRGHTFNITSVAFSPDGQYLASGSWDNTVQLWDLNPPVAKPKILPGHQKTVRAIAISQQDQEEPLLASGSEDGTVRVWNLNQPNAEPKTFECGGRVFGVALFISGDRQVQLLAAGSDDKIIRLWDLQQTSDVPLREFNGHQDGVSSVAFSPDGRWLASGSWNTTVRLWDLDQPDPKPIIFQGDKGHTDSVTSVKFSPDGTILASASDDKRVLLWNLEQFDAAPIELKNHSGRVWSIAFSPDGQLLASASDDWTVRLWNLEKLDLENPDLKNLVHVSLKGHSAWVSSVAFSPDGKTLASGSFDRSIRLWQIDQIDWKSGTIMEAPIVLEDHNQSVTSVAFTPDGKYLASGSYDNTVRLWIARTEDLADMVCKKVLRNLTKQEWQQFMGGDIPYEQTCPNLPPGVLLAKSL